DGVVLTGGGATGNTVVGNYIGTNAAGTAALGNANGILIDSAPNNTIGGLTATPGTGAGNVVSGNAADGIRVQGASDGTLIQGNIAGLNAAGNAPLPNFDGVVVAGVNNVTIGGTAAGARNVFSGNNREGIGVGGGGAVGDVVQGNYVGTDVTG